MEKEKNLNTEIIKQLVLLYQIISETNNLDKELNELVKTNRPEDSELIKSKQEALFSKWKEAGKRVDTQLALAKSFSTIFESDINSLAIEIPGPEKKRRINPVGKKYAKLRIYYQATDNGFSKGRPAYSWIYPQFGITLVCSLSFNDRIFKFVIAKTEKGCNKIWPCEISAGNKIIANEYRGYASPGTCTLQFCSEEKFTEVANICETITERVNAELKKAGLEKFLSNTELSEK